jgi:peptidoglycan hydrolase CwlO-like protein
VLTFPLFLHLAVAVSAAQRFAQQEALTAAAEEAKRSVEARMHDKADALTAALRELEDTREELRVRSELVARLEGRVARAEAVVKQKNDILRKQVRRQPGFLVLFVKYRP